MSWRVNFYPKETEKFISKLCAKDQADVLSEIDALREYGFSEHNDSLKKMVGLSGVWELKIKQYRLFLIQTETETLQVLHMIIKKSNKTPLEIIELIKSRAKYF